MYLRKCPRCGKGLEDEVEYDIVVSQSCEDGKCGFYKSYGYAELVNGVSRLVPCDQFDCYDDLDDFDEDSLSPDEVINIGLMKDRTERYDDYNYEEDEDCPF